jgi:hypothetical protein
VARIETKLADLHALKGIPVSGPQNLDEFRKKDLPPGKALETAAPSSIDPLAFLVGRVEVNVTEAGGVSKLVDLSPYLDRAKGTARSLTGELAWDFQAGLLRIDAPQAQGVAGFLSKAGAATLGDVVIESPMDYGAIVVVSLDDQPVKSSRRLLLQAFSEEQPHGWSAPGEGLRPIAETGGPPIVVKKLEGKVTLRRADAASLKVRALDPNGIEDKAVKVPGGASIALAPASMYLLIEK